MYVIEVDNAEASMTKDRAIEEQPILSYPDDQEKPFNQEPTLYVYDPQEEQNFDYVSTLPQYPVMLPMHYPGQQQQFVVLPYQYPS